MSKIRPEIQAFRESGEYLPKIMRDFHDAKDVFKTIGNYESSMGEVNWCLGQCYLIDWFLWKMAAYGYTLQPSRKKLQFYDIQDAIKARQGQEVEMLQQLIVDKRNQEATNGD